MQALKGRARASKPPSTGGQRTVIPALNPSPERRLKRPTPLSEIDRIALILWETAQLTPAGRTYVLAALATADALLNGHHRKVDS